jgi:hypothetical protein
MAGGTTFAELLDAQLNCTAVPPAAPVWSNRPVTSALFVFDLPLTPAAQPPAPAYVRHQPAVAAAHAAAPDTASSASVPPAADTAGDFVEPSFPHVSIHRSRLTMLEQRALAALNRLGADLDEHLTPATLRRAFKALAHRYHPDRHPGCSADEQARLARLFADATAHYRLLAAGLEQH